MFVYKIVVFKMQGDEIKIFINNHYKWINPLLILITTITSSLITYSLPIDYEKNHPIRFAIFNPIIENIGFLFIPTIIFLAYVTYVDVINKKTIDELKKENEECKLLSTKISENIKNLFNGFLFKFADSKVGFSSTERITLYIHDNNNGFVAFGRYSQNPTFRNQGRHRYPDNEGCIAEGWTKTWHFDNKFESGDKYLEKNKSSYKIDNKVIKKMKMKSNLFAVLRLDNQGKPLAVIVVESTDSKKYDEKNIKKILENEQDYLTEMIVSLEKFIHKPSDAKSIEEI
jgi:hypothetical protein